MLVRKAGGGRVGWGPQRDWAGEIVNGQSSRAV